MRKTIPTLALAALALSGCGGDADPAPSSPAAETATTAGAPTATVAETSSAPTTEATTVEATTTTTTPSESATTAEPEPTEVIPTGENALALGEWLNMREDTVRVRVLAVKPKVPRTYPGDSPGVDFAAVQVELCVVQDPGLDITTSWDPWSLVTKDGMLSTMPSSWSDADFPGQEYPAYGDTPMRKGQCRKGWLLQEVAKGAKLDVVQYYSQSGEAHWRIKP